MLWFNYIISTWNTLFLIWNSNPEFQKSVKELNEKIGVVTDDLKVK